MTLKERILELVDNHPFTLVPERCRGMWHGSLIGETTLETIKDLYGILDAVNRGLRFPIALSPKEKSKTDLIDEEVHALIFMQEPFRKIMDLTFEHVTFNDEASWMSLIVDSYYGITLPSKEVNIVKNILTDYSNGTISFSQAKYSFNIIKTLIEDEVYYKRLDDMLECFVNGKRLRHLS